MDMSGFDKRRSMGFRIALGGIKGLARILVLVLIVVVVIAIGKMAYHLGYETFATEAVSHGEGEYIMFSITEDMKVRDIGAELKKKGLIDESAAAFSLQAFLYGAKDKIQPGTYTLSTSSDPEEILKAISKEPEEE